jgi:hypothetical protein
MVKVYVGRKRELDIFPEALLVERFPFFNAAFQSGFRESTDKSIDLAEDDPAAFSYVINMAFGEGWKMSAKLESVGAQLKLANAYIVADKLGRPDLASSISEDYQCLFYNEGSFDDYLVCGRAAKLVYENTAESAPIRGYGGDGSSSIQPLSVLHLRGNGKVVEGHHVPPQVPCRCHDLY